MKAGNFIRNRIKSSFEITEKTCVSDLVTDVDKETESFLVNSIIDKYPEDTFITEERTVNSDFGDKCWIIDPIDGTLNFIYEQKNYAISVAYYGNKEPAFGIVYDVFEDNLYLGIKNKGSYVNGKKVNRPPFNTLSTGIVDVNLKNMGLIKELINLDMEEVCKAALNFRHLGSAAIRICDIALNKAHVYISPNLAIWDYAAANIFLKECGGDYWILKTDNKKSPDLNSLVIAAQNKDLLNEVINYSSIC